MIVRKLLPFLHALQGYVNLLLIRFLCFHELVNNAILTKYVAKMVDTSSPAMSKKVYNRVRAKVISFSFT